MELETDELDYTRRLPKVEVHAHLSGSIPDDLLATFLAEDGPRNGPCGAFASAADLTLLSRDSERSLSQCFRVFDLIHTLIRSKDRLRRATIAALRAFDDDGCIYLELRTTPRACEGAFSAMDYLTTVLDVIVSWPGRMECRLLLSVNRAQPVVEAYETVDLIRQLDQKAHPHRGHIVGFELSGNPAKGNFHTFEPVFRQVRREFGSRFGISLHFAELHNEDEAKAMLDFGPERVGHAVCMSRDTEHRLLGSAIFVEVCLTSNLISQSVEYLKDHPVVTALDGEQHPYSVCTDDSGVFRTSLSAEYALLRDILPNVKLEAVTKIAIANSFAPAELKEKLFTVLGFNDESALR